LNLLETTFSVKGDGFVAISVSLNTRVISNLGVENATMLLCISGYLNMSQQEQNDSKRDRAIHKHTHKHTHTHTHTLFKVFQ